MTDKQSFVDHENRSFRFICCIVHYNDGSNKDHCTAVMGLSIGSLISGYNTRHGYVDVCFNITVYYCRLPSLYLSVHFLSRHGKPDVYAEFSQIHLLLLIHF